MNGVYMGWSESKWHQIIIYIHFKSQQLFNKIKEQFKTKRENQWQVTKRRESGLPKILIWKFNWKISEWGLKKNCLYLSSVFNNYTMEGESIILFVPSSAQLRLATSTLSTCPGETKCLIYGLKDIKIIWEMSKIF